MDLPQMLIYLVLLIQVVLVLVTVYLYLRNRLRLFIMLCLGFLALLIATTLRIALPDADIALYVNMLEVVAGMAFLAGVLSTV